MRNDVYIKIIDICVNAIKSAPQTKSHEELCFQTINNLSIISGICGGAISSEKGSEEAEK